MRGLVWAGTDLGDVDWRGHGSGLNCIVHICMLTCASCHCLVGYGYHILGGIIVPFFGGMFVSSLVFHES